MITGHDADRLLYPLINELRNISHAIYELRTEMAEVRRFREFVAVRNPKLLGEYHRYDMVDQKFKEVR